MNALITKRYLQKKLQELNKALEKMLAIVHI